MSILFSNWNEIILKWKNYIQMFDRIILLIYNLIGGWVRDKLLDLSDKEDIDLAVDNMTGKEFAFSLNKWSQKRGKY